MRHSHYLVLSCGSSHIAAVHLSMNSSGRCELVDYWRKELGLSLSDPLLWLKAASQFFSEARSKFRGDYPVGYSLPGHLVLSKYLKIPKSPRSKRDKIIAFEAKQNIPFPISEVAWDDYLIWEDGLDFEALIAASKTDLVESLSLYGKQADMDPDVIEPGFVGMVNAFRFNMPDTKGCSLLLSIGAKSTDIIFVLGSKFYTRNVPIGGNWVTQAIRSNLGFSFDDAEKIKRLAAAGESLPRGEYVVFDEAREAFLKRLYTEISRTLAIYKNHGHESEPQQCFISGGGSLIPGIESKLSDRLGLPVERFDPLKEISVGPQCKLGSDSSAKAFLGEAIGIALGRFLPDSVRINLLPRSILWQRRFKRQQPYYLGAGLVACAAVALPLVNTKIAMQRYYQEIQNLDTMVQPLQALNTRINGRFEEIEKLKGLIEESHQLVDARSNWMRFLNDIQIRMDAVEDVWLDKIEVTRPSLASAASGNRFNDAPAGGDEGVRLHLEGRLLDVANPLSTVSQESNRRVSELLASLGASSFVARLEDERFDTNVPGILKFNFTLVVDASNPL